MYLPEEIIKVFLKYCGYDEINQIYVSSKENKTKYKGDLFKKVIKQENCDAQKIVHIGDSFYADFRQAKRYGINAFFYKDRLIDREYSLYLSAKPGVAVKKEQAFWYSIGYQTGGPFYLLLCQWIRKIVGQEKCFLISRDGYLLNEIFQMLQLTNFEYLYLSRRALTLACITKLDEETLENMPPYSCGQSIRQVLDYLNFNEIKEEEFLKKGFPSLDYMIRSKKDIRKIKEVFQNNERWILKKCEEERKAALSYFYQKQIFGQKQFYFDAGWSGNSQKMLEKLQKISKNTGENIFLYAGIKRDYKSRSILKGKSYFHLLFDQLKRSDRKNLEKATAVLELFFSAPFPSLHRYGKEGLEFDKYSINYDITALNQGVIDYVIEHKEMKVTTSYATREFIRMIKNPTKREAQKIGRVENSDIFSENHETPKYLAYLTMEYFLKNPRTEIFWPQGIYHNPDNSCCVKLLVFIRQLLLEVKNRKRNSEVKENEKKGTE